MTAVPRWRRVRRGRRPSAALLLLAAAGFAGADCTPPPRPTIPDGARASHTAMVAGQEAVKAFQSANMAYMHCLEEAFRAVKAAAEAGDGEAKRTYEAATQAYNAAVSADEEVAGDFNIELREYRARHR